MTTTTTTSSEQTGAHKRHVRNFLLDSHFQLKYAGFLVAVAIVISALVGSVLYATVRAMVIESAKVVEESRKASDESRKVSSVSRMNVRDLAPESPELFVEFNREADAYDKAIADHQKAVAVQQDSLIRRQRWMIVSLVGGLALMVVLIGLLGIYFTHKVAGPVFKMGQLLKQVGRGNLRVEARLRRGDELQSFFDTFTKMVSGLRDHEKRRLDDLEVAIKALERSEPKEAALALDRMRRAIREAIGE
jgi:nitrogen fixation/metabolism regulation signal transduction histidine kinase